jgi:hypothetical protein
MATPEQKTASGKVMEAVKALNRALSEAGGTGLHIDLEDVRTMGTIVPQYVVATIETREMVLP